MKLDSLNAELRKVERRRLQLEQKIKAQSALLFKSLPGKVGLKSVDALVLALVPYASPALQQRIEGAVSAQASKAAAPKRANPAIAAPMKSTAAKAPKQTRGRAGHPEEKMTAARRAFQDGKLTIREISTKHGVPTDTLKKWKRKWGLTEAPKTSKTAR
jgi:helix-turn-helix, Psq domain